MRCISTLPKSQFTVLRESITEAPHSLGTDCFIISTNETFLPNRLIESVSMNDQIIPLLD